MTDEQHHDEPILRDNGNRFCIYPIHYPDIWEAYKKHKSGFWTAEEIDFSADRNDWERLDQNEKYFIEHILAFFAGSDGIVLENLVSNFCKEIPIPEVRCFYAFQGMMENIHCVAGDTKILTDRGYIEIETIVDRLVNVWNGVEFSEVRIQYTGHQDIYRVELSNGMTLDCTPGHRWSIMDCDKKVPTVELKIDDRIAPYHIPFMKFHNPGDLKNPYLQGFMAGQQFDSDYKIDDHSVMMTDLMIVPMNYSETIRIRWLEGLTESYIGKVCLERKRISYKTNDSVFLRDVQLLLTTLSVKSKIVSSENNNDWTLFIEGYEFEKLQDIGFVVKDLRLWSNTTKQDHDNRKNDDVRVVMIEKIGIEQPTFCFHEPKRGMGVFNGILTYQSEVYSLLIDTYVSSPDRKLFLFNAIEEIPCVKKKALWALQYMDPSCNCFAKRLVAFGIVEGVFFSGAFCSIFWLKERGLMTKSLGKSNEWICRDEGLHTDFAVLLYKYIKKRIPETEVHEMFKDAVTIEQEFICESLPCRLIGMNQDLMCQYIKYVADRLLTQFGYKKIYMVSNPFPFMSKISLEGKTNFFEQRVTEYVLSSSTKQNIDFDVSNVEDDDF